MTRDEIILSCQDTVNNLVRKYNNHRPDEDLQAVGMTAVIECVDRCLDEGLIDINQIQARCNTWARNMILNETYTEKIKFAEDNSALEYLVSDENLWETIVCVRKVLTPRNNEVFDLLLKGCSQQQIMTKLNMAKPTYFNHLSKIKEKIKNLSGSKD